MRLYDKFNEWFYPELKRFPPGQGRKRAMQEAISSSASDWRPYALILGTCAAEFVLGHWLFEPMAVLGPSVMFLLVLVLQFAMLLRFCRQRSGPALRRLLTELGTPICTRCGYDLAGNTSGICPERGTPQDAPNRESAT